MLQSDVDIQKCTGFFSILYTYYVLTLKLKFQMGWQRIWIIDKYLHRLWLIFYSRALYMLKTFKKIRVLLNSISRLYIYELLRSDIRLIPNLLSTRQQSLMLLFQLFTRYLWIFLSIVCLQQSLMLLIIINVVGNIC